MIDYGKARVNYSTAPLSPLEEQSALSKLASHSGKLVSDALYHVATPGAYIQSGLEYLKDGTWDDPHDPDSRKAVNESLIDSTGLTSATGRFVAGLAIDVLTDPFTLMTGPLGSLSKAGKAAKAVGVLDNAAATASRSLQDDVIKGAMTAGVADTPALQAATKQLGGRAGRTMRALKRDNIADFTEHTARPLVGQAEALQKTTLEQVMATADDSAKRSLDAYLAKQGILYDDIAKEKLGSSFGASIPYVGSIAGNPLGDTVGAGTAALLDRAGETLRWSPIGRAAHQFANKDAGGMFDAVGQAQALEINAGANIGEATGRRIASDLAQDVAFAEIPADVAQRTGITSLKGSDGVKAAEAIDRYIGGIAATANDIDFVENTPGVKAFVDKSAALLPDILARSKAAGLNAHQLMHKFGERYRPYQLTTGLDEAIARASGSGKGAHYDLVTGDMAARQKSLQLPGGLDHLRFFAKDKTLLSGRKLTDDEVAERIFAEVNDPNSAYYQTVAGTKASMYPADLAAARTKLAADKLLYKQRQLPKGSSALTQGPVMPKPELGAPVYTKGNSRALAQFLNKLDPKDPVAFGNHPAEAIARYATGRYRAEGTADSLLEAVVSRAVEMKAGSLPGGKSVSLKQALANVGMKSQKDAVTGLAGGAAHRAREAIAAKLTKMGKATSADEVMLAEYSVPREFIDTLTKSHNLLVAPKERGALMQGMNELTRLFKNQILAWPSRITRDVMSGWVGNMVTVGTDFVPGLLNGNLILEGKYAEALPYIKKMPLYANLDDDAALKAYMLDVAESGILGGMGAAEREVGDRTGKSLLEIVPGATPQSLSRSVTESGNWLSRETLNPIGIKGVSIGNRPRGWKGYATDTVSDPFGVAGASPAAMPRKETTNPFFRTFEKLSEWSDSHNRLGGYNGLIAQGVSPKEAARRMKAVHVDYDSLSSSEKAVRDSIVPFYAYAARSGQFAIGEVLGNPGGHYARTIRSLDKAQQSDEDFYMPGTMRDRTALRLPEELFGSFASPAPGISRVLTNIDVPGMSALNMFASERAGSEFDTQASIIGTAQNALAQASPALKTMMEMGSGIDMYTKKEIGAVPSQIDRLMIGLTGDEDARAGPLAKHALDLFAPGAGRVIGAAATVLDPRFDSATNVLNAGINAIAPVKTALVDQRQQDRDAVGEIDSMLRRLPQAKRFSMTSIKDEDFASLDPEMQKMVLLKKTIEKRQRTEAKERERRAKRFAG